MSRILIFDQNNQPVSEVHAPCNRGWAISDGGNTNINFSAVQAENPNLQIGNLVYIPHPFLPGWAGMIDTPWKAIKPINLTLYDIPYFLSRRSIFYPGEWSGSIGSLAARFIDEANKQGDTTILPGVIDYGGPTKTPVIDNRVIWDQLKELVINSGMEMQLRSELGSDRRLVTYLDIQKALGVDSGFLLHDGEDGNAVVTDAVVDGEIWNSVIGVSDDSTAASKKYSPIVRDETSIKSYRVRNTVQQISSSIDSELENTARSFLNLNAGLKITLTLKVNDSNGAFKHMRLGNSFKLALKSLCLPGGRVGWSGAGRIAAMSYEELANQVTIKMEGAL